MDGPAQKGKPDKPPENINLRSRGREIATWKLDERRFASARDERDGVRCVRSRNRYERVKSFVINRDSPVIVRLLTDLSKYFHSLSTLDLVHFPGTRLAIIMKRVKN